jgi:peroxiredoxin
MIRGRLAAWRDRHQHGDTEPTDTKGWLITDSEHQVAIGLHDGHVRISLADLEAHTGWSVESRGLCRDGVCTPWPDGVAVSRNEMIDLDVVARTLGLPLATADTPHGVVAVLGRPAEDWPARKSPVAPDVELTDLDGRKRRLTDFSGRRRVLLSFASWCGCRDDLPAWQALVDELSDQGDFTFLAIAIDESPDDVRELAAGATFPVLIDRDRTFCDAYGVIHVPTVTWIDSDDRIVRPNDIVFADDRLREHHGFDSSVHHDALRRWLTTGEAPLQANEVRERQMPPTDSEQRGRTEFRLALWLLRHGLADQADHHFDAAERYSPEDFTIRRAAIKLRGGDPFGEEFVKMYEHWMTVSGGEYYRPRRDASQA